MADPLEQQQQNPDATGPSTDLSTSNQPQGTTRIENGIAYDVSGKALGPAAEAPGQAASQQPVDLVAAAKAFGAAPAPQQAPDLIAAAQAAGAAAVPPTKQPKTAPQQTYDLLVSTLGKGRVNTALSQAKNVSDYIYNNILSTDSFHNNGLTYDENPSTAWGKAKQRLWGWLTQDEINKIPGLEPDRVAQLEQQGHDELGDLFGKERATQLREHLLNGSYVVNQPPEVFARAAAKTVSDFFSPGYYALGAFGKVAQGYSKAAQAAAAAGDWTKAAKAMGTARLLGLLGTGVNIPFAASQAHDLAENWDKMSVPERVAAVSGILGAGINTHIGINAAGGYKDVAQSTVQSRPVQAVRDAVGSMVTLGKAQDFNTAVERASNITAKNLAQHRYKISNSSADLQAILNKNPHVGSPQEFANAINSHIQEQEQALQAAAGATRNDITPVVPNIEQRVIDRLNKYFDDNRGKFGTTEEVYQAKEDILDRIMQGGQNNKRAPNLYEAENVRQGLNGEAAPAYDMSKKQFTSAYKAGAFEAAKEMRDAIDESYENRGIDNVKEFREKEANLIDIRDRLSLAQTKAEDMGNGSLWSTIWKKFGGPSTVIAIALGSHNPLTWGALGYYLADRGYQNRKNPTLNVERAAKLANPNAKATEVEVNPQGGPAGSPAVPTPPTTPPTAGPAPKTPPPTHPSQANPHPTPAPVLPPPPHEIARAAEAVAPGLMDEAPSNHALNAELATHFGEPLDHAPLEDRVEHVKNDVEAMRRSNVAITPAQNKVLGAINEHEAEQTAAVEDHQKKSRDDAYKYAEELHKMLAQEAEQEKQEQYKASKKAQELSQERKVNPETEPLHWQEENQRLKSVINNPEATAEEKATAQQRLQENEAMQKSLSTKQQALEYTDEEIPVPEHYSYVTPRQTRTHELGHLIASHAMGLPILDVISHLHPEIDPQALAEARSDLSSLKNERGELDADKVEDKLPELLVRAVAGGVAEEVYGGIPFEENKTTASDLDAVHGLLKNYDISDDVAELMLKKAKERAKNLLTNDGMTDIFDRYAEKRIAGTHQNYHLNPESTTKLIEELGAINDRQTQTRRSSGVSKEAVRLDQESNAGAEGQRQKEASRRLQTKQQAGLVEKSTGDPEIDAVIRNGGGIPAGMMDMGEFGRIHMFHDPENGSTLGFKPNEKITPQMVGKKLAANREAFAKGEEANRQREEEEKKAQLATKQQSLQEKARDLASKIGGRVVGSAAKESGAPNDMDIRIDSPQYDRESIHNALKKEGLTYRGSSVVSPEEAAESEKNFGKGWSRVEHFEDSSGKKVLDVWRDANEDTTGGPGFEKAQKLVDEINKKNLKTKQQAAGVEEPTEAKTTSQKLVDKYGTTTNPHEAGFILADGRMVPLHSEHDLQISSALGKFGAPAAGLREGLINDEQVVRTRARVGRGGQEIVFSVPKQGVTPEQIRQIKKSVGMLREGNTTSIEVAEPNGKFTRKEFARVSDVEPMLKEIGALPKTVPAEETKTQNELRAAANEYNKAQGRPNLNTAPVQEDPRSSEIADAYKAATHEPNNPAVKASYDALKRDIDTQYDMLKKMGLKLETAKENPYGLNTEVPAHEELHQDVLGNKHLAVWEGGAPPADHPLSERDPKTGLTYNDKFRMVHDVFGHAAERTDFSPAGEESAWNLHRQLFSPEARPALATETRGQAAYTYKYGDFPPQKATILPEHLQVRPEDLLNVDLKKHPAGGIDPRTGSMESKRFGLEIHPEDREELDHNPTAQDFSRYAAEHQDVLKQHPDMKIGWDTLGKKPELNIGISTDDLDAAKKVAAKLDQRSIWDTKEEKEIPVGGQNQKRKFPDYPLSARLNDLRTKQQQEEGFDFGANAEGTPDQQKGLISTATPSGKKAIGDPLAQDIHISLHSVTPKAAGAIAGKIREMPGFRIPENIKDPMKVIGRYIDQFKNNLIDVHNQVPPEKREQTKKWYESANKLAVDTATKYGKTDKQGAGVIAALSPQKDWDQNVGLAQRVFDIYHTKQDATITPEMRDKLTSLVTESKSKPKEEMTKEDYIERARNAKLASLVDGIGERPYRDLSIPEKAAFTRLYDEAHNPRSYAKIDPGTGESLGNVTTDKGNNRKIAWGSLNEIGKAISILEDGSRENISNNLGENHKVRSFYNNILDPNNPAGHVTVDTHAVAAGHQRPLGGNEPDVKANFGGISAKETGLKGMYAVNAEAYRQAAAELGLQPRQLQSIVWEKIREQYPDELKRNQKLREGVDQIWAAYKEGEITQKQAQDAVREFSAKSWETMKANKPQESKQTGFNFGNMPVAASKFANIHGNPDLNSGLDKLAGK